MKQEDKELLLKDLSARLPYKVKCNVYNRIGTLTGVNDYGAEIDYGNGEDTTCEIQYCLPYLRPMSSMTEEEVEELNNIVDKELKDSEPYFVYEQLTVDFYLSHHLDNRLMIEKGLALEAPERMYNIK